MAVILATVVMDTVMDMVQAIILVVIIVAAIYSATTIMAIMTTYTSAIHVMAITGTWTVFGAPATDTVATTAITVPNIRTVESLEATPNHPLVTGRVMANGLQCLFLYLNKFPSYLCKLCLLLKGDFFFQQESKRCAIFLGTQ